MTDTHVMFGTDGLRQRIMRNTMWWAKHVLPWIEGTLGQHGLRVKAKARYSKHWMLYLGVLIGTG